MKTNLCINLEWNYYCLKQFLRAEVADIHDCNVRCKTSESKFFCSRSTFFHCWNDCNFEIHKFTHSSRSNASNAKLKLYSQNTLHTRPQKFQGGNIFPNFKSEDPKKRFVLSDFRMKIFSVE